MLTTLKALSDPTRLRLVAILSRGEFTVQEITAIMKMGQSRISRHLKILTEAGVLSVKRQGTWGYYRLADSDDLFREIYPALARRFDTLGGASGDLEGLATILEERRRRSLDFFDLHARQWDDLAGEILPLPDYLDALVGFMPTCASLLEVGVGTGRLLSALCGKSRRVLGVDHSPAMVQEARRRVAEEKLGGVDLRLGEMSHLPLQNGEVEVAVFNMVLHHAARPASLFEEVFRVLGPGGRLVIADLQRHEKEWARERLADQWLGFEREDLENWLRGAGFALCSYLAISGRGEEEGVFILVAEKIYKEEAYGR